MPTARSAPLPRRVPVLLAMLAAVLVACGGDSSPTNPSPTSGSLSGVVRGAGNAPLAGANVTVGTLSATSGADGSYSFADVPLGPRTLAASAAGYASFSTQVTVVAGSTTRDIALQRAVVFLADTAALYIPSTVTTVRAVMIYLGSFDTRPVATSQFDTSQTGVAMQAFRGGVSAILDQRGVALMGITAVSRSDDASMAAAITSALSALATASGHPEVATAPLLPVGMSGGARPTNALLQLQPQRLVGFFTWIGVFSPFLTSAQMRQVPGALLLAERDSIVDNASARSWFDANRSQGALWSIGTQPNAIHDPPNPAVRNAMFQWLDDELAARLPPGATTLVAQSENAGWLGDLTALTISDHAQYGGDPFTAAWFPSQAFAARWQSVVTIPSQ